MPDYTFLHDTQTPHWGNVKKGEVKTLDKSTGDQLRQAGFVRPSTPDDKKKRDSGKETK